jgi:hypothetical protein
VGQFEKTLALTGIGFIFRVLPRLALELTNFELEMSMAVPLTVSSPSNGDSELPSTLTYFAERRAAGYIGIALPLLVLLYDGIAMGCVPGSISGSYHTDARNIFVGSLCAVGVFLVCSIGYKDDKWWSILAGVLAVIVAFCPTKVDEACKVDGASNLAWTPVVHGIAACALFLVFTYFCLVLFTRTHANGTVKKRPALKELRGPKKQRNIVYIVCGWIMLAAIGVFALFSIVAAVHKNFTEPRYLVFGVEWVCLWSFGFAWLVKGQQLFKDV